MLDFNTNSKEIMIYLMNEPSIDLVIMCFFRVANAVSA